MYDDEGVKHEGELCGDGIVYNICRNHDRHEDAKLNKTRSLPTKRQHAMVERVLTF